MCVKINEKDLSSIFTAAALVEMGIRFHTFGVAQYDRLTSRAQDKDFPQTLVRPASEKSGPVCQSPRYVF